MNENNENEINEYDDDNESEARKTYLSILKSAHSPLQLSAFSQNFQDDFKKIADDLRKWDMVKLQKQADLIALASVIYYELYSNDALKDENNRLLNITAEQKEFKKNIDLIDAFTPDAVISISHPNSWMSVNIYEDLTVAETWLESPNPEVFYANEFYGYLYKQSEFLIREEVYEQITPEGHSFLATHGVKLRYEARYEFYFEYSQKFLDGLFREKHFKFVK